MLVLLLGKSCLTWAGSLFRMHFPGTPKAIAANPKLLCQLKRNIKATRELLQPE